MRLASTLAALTMLGAVLPTAPALGAARCATAHPGDLNGDGFGDLAVTELGRTRLQGAVHVIYGTASGLTAEPSATAPDDQFLSQDSPGVPDTSEDADEWGATLAIGDFNADRCADLAIGAPGENQTAGAVTILYGSPTGLTTTNTRQFSQDSGHVPDSAEPNDRFGATLAVGDFDGDGADDLAVGAPGETIGRAFGTGDVDVLWGSHAGLGYGRRPTELRPGAGVAGGRHDSGDAFGAALAAGDLNHDHRDELVVGSPGENGSGSIQIFPGGPDGFRTAGTVYDRGFAPGTGTPTSGDAFGAAVSTGDYDADGRTDVAVGIPGANRSTGAVEVLYGGGSLLSARHAQLWTQGAGGLGGAAEAGDRFGAVLASGVLSKGSTADLAIGVPGDSAGPVPGAGAVQVLLGTSSGLTAVGSQLLNQATTGVAGDPTTGDRFGSALAIRSITGSGPAQLVVGVPAEGVPGTATQRCGAFTVFAATPQGPGGVGSQFWALGQSGLSGTPARGVFLGYALG